MTRSRSPYWLAAVAAVLVASIAPRVTGQAPAEQQSGPRPEPQMDPARVKKLYVSNNPDDHSLGRDFQRDVEQKGKTDARFVEASKGVMDLKTLERMDTPEQRDSWNRTWAFFEWHLRPYEDRSQVPTAQQ